MLPALHSLEFRVHTRVLVTLLVVLLVTASVLAEPAHRTLLREATEAQRAGDTAKAISLLESAAAVRPDYPRVLLNLARLRCAAGRADEAVVALRRLADLGLALKVKEDAAFAPLANRDDFAAIARQFIRNSLPQGVAFAGIELPGRTGIIESAAQSAGSGDWFFGDVRERCVWHRHADGRIEKFPDDTGQPGGVFAVLIDEDRGALWLSTSWVPQVSGYSGALAGTACLREYDLGTGKLRRSVELPRHESGRVVGSLALAADGTLYASDSTAPEIWRVAPASREARLFATSDEFVSLQGLALVDEDRALVVADYANGLWRIDTATADISLLPPPDKTTFFGLDGLTAAPEGLVAIQNGVSPERLLLIRMDAGRAISAEVLAAGQPGFGDLATGTVADGRAWVVATSGWAQFDDPAATPPPRTVLLFQTTLN